MRSNLLHGALAGLVGLATAFAAPSSMVPAAAAAEPTSRAYLHAYNLPAHGVALDGYSPVSYFDGVAERGDALFSVEHDGVTYHLTSADQVSTFRRDPQRFVPAFGGWCAFGMSVSDKFPVDPTNFMIVDGRLLVFLRNAGLDARELWRKGNAVDLLRKAEAHWKKVQG